jgi:hypothetical protein
MRQSSRQPPGSSSSPLSRCISIRLVSRSLLQRATDGGAVRSSAASLSGALLWTWRVTSRGVTFLQGGARDLARRRSVETSSTARHRASPGGAVGGMLREGSWHGRSGSRRVGSLAGVVEAERTTGVPQTTGAPRTTFRRRSTEVEPGATLWRMARR